jgi:K+-transporting ATPase KdpF subunit
MRTVSEVIVLFCPSEAKRRKTDRENLTWTSLLSGLAFCFSLSPLLTSKSVTGFDREDQTMLVDYILGGGVTLFLLAYLTYALVRPERF